MFKHCYKHYESNLTVHTEGRNETSDDVPKPVSWLSRQRKGLSVSPVGLLKGAFYSNWSVKWETSANSIFLEKYYKNIKILTKKSCVLTVTLIRLHFWVVTIWENFNFLVIQFSLMTHILYTII